MSVHIVKLTMYMERQYGKVMVQPNIPALARMWLHLLRNANYIHDVISSTRFLVLLCPPVIIASIAPLTEDQQSKYLYLFENILK